MNVPISVLLLITGLTIVPAVFWILVYRYLDNRDPEPRSVVLFALLGGIISSFPVFIIQYVFSEYPEYNFIYLLGKMFSDPKMFLLVFLLFVGVIEEFFKAFAFLLVFLKAKPFFDQVVDGIVLGALIGVGFGLAENVYYFSRAYTAFDLSSSFVAVFIIRSFGTMLAHTLFTGLFGFFFARAYFSTALSLSAQNGFLGFFIKYSRILLGFCLAVLSHFIFNMLIKMEFFGRSWSFLAIPVVFFLALFIWTRFFVLINTKIIPFLKRKRA